MRLARPELRAKGRQAGIGVGAVGLAGIVALFGAAALLTAVVLALDTVLVTWFSAAIVGVALLAVAGVVALTGSKQLDRATPPAPAQTESVEREA